MIPINTNFGDLGIFHVDDLPLSTNLSIHVLKTEMSYWSSDHEKADENMVVHFMTDL